jgi:hypothetical protein
MVQHEQTVAEQLSALFQRNGYVRRQNSERLAEEGHRRYKKGDEVRLIASSEAELQEIRQLLLAAGLRPGRPYAQKKQIRQPVYGRDQVSRFLQLIGVEQGSD